MTHHALTTMPEPVDHSHPHPTERKYIQIAIILTIITIVEVAIYYVDWMHDSGALVPALFVLSIAKFITVVGYYMHLKFDDPRFRYIFMGGLALALGVIGALYALLIVHRIDIAFGFI
jgi:cytochrome c oxidase subunit 4